MASAKIKAIIKRFEQMKSAAFTAALQKVTTEDLQGYLNGEADAIRRVDLLVQQEFRNRFHVPRSVPTQ